MNHQTPARAPRLVTSLLALSLLSTPFAKLSAQTPQPAPDDESAPSGRSETVELSPFEVSTSQDKGYRATNSISGTRLNTPIKEIPMPIEVITEKLLRDTGSTDLRQSLRYSAGILLQSQNDQGTPGGAYQGPGGVNNPEGATANKTQTSIKIRGYVTDTVLRDGYRRQTATDSINISRVEVVRGPAALLYGIGNFGGIVNYLPKNPDSKPGGEVAFTYGMNDFMRGAFSVTGPLTESWNLNYRLSAAYQDTEDYTDFRTERHYFVSPIITFKPTKTTDVVIDYEQGKQWEGGVGFQRVRASANVGVNNDQNEHSGFLTLPGTNPRTFRWSGPDTYIDTESDNLRLQVTQKLADNLYFLLGYNTSSVDFDQLDVQGNLQQNVGPEALRSTVILSPIDQVRGSSNLNIVFGPVPNSILQYMWTQSATETSREQVRAELTYNLKLFSNANKWLRLNNSILLGRSEERADTDVTTFRTPDNEWNWKNPNDATPIRFGQQGDGTADVPMVKYNGRSAVGWNQGSYAVYQGKLLDERLVIVAGVRRDRNDNRTRTFNYVADTEELAQRPSQAERTSQYGASFQITREISVYALRAEGLQPNFSGDIDVNGTPLGPVLARSKEFGVKIDLLDGKISGTISSYKIERTGTPIFYWWAPTSNYRNFDPSRDIIYNVANFSPSSVPGGSNGGNGAADAALAQWNAGVASGAIYQKLVGGTTNWYVNASRSEGAAYLDAVFDYTKAHNMSWPGWLYNYDAETNNSWNDRASGPQGNEYVTGSDKADGWDAQLMFTPTDNFQVIATYAHTKRVIDSAGQFARTPNPQDRWAVWYFPNTDWGLTGKPIDVVYGDPSDTSTWTGIGYGTGEKQDDTPEHQVSLWSNYTFTEGLLKGFSFGAGGYWESSREYMSGITHGGGQRVTDADGNLVVLSTDDRYNIDLMARYDFKLGRNAAAVQLNVYNVLNDQKRYGLIYSAPTSARVEFSYRF
ncbi:MAG TPA: TonB-dependent receptor plug domain-containing protein [Opitutaceae bacterium]